MSETVSKKIPPKSRSPAVGFRAGPNGLSIVIQMTREKAQAIADRAAGKARAKATASKAVLSALRDLMDEDTRDRSGFLQANIPAELKAELGEVAKAKRTTVTKLIRDQLFAWINPGTGEFFVKKGKDGSASRAGPKNYRSYVGGVDSMYTQALETRSWARLQVEVGNKVARRINRLLNERRFSKARFLTALAMDVRDRNQAAASKPAEPGRGEA